MIAHHGMHRQVFFLFGIAVKKFRVLLLLVVSFAEYVNLPFVFILQHWIRLELHPDLLIQRLSMTVDPSDSSYMPSVVVISAGDSMQSLKEIKTVHINPTDSAVTLLEDAQEVREFLCFTV